MQRLKKLVPLFTRQFQPTLPRSQGQVIHDYQQESKQGHIPNQGYIPNHGPPKISKPKMIMAFLCWSVCPAFALFTIINVCEYIDEKKRKKDFIARVVADIDINGMKLLFTDLVVINASGKVVDLSEIKKAEGRTPNPQGQSYEQSQIQEQNPEPIPKIGRLFDFCIASRYHRKKDVDAKVVRSLVHMQLLKLQYALTVIKRMDADPDSIRNYNAKVGVEYLARYFVSTQRALEKGEITFDPARSICKMMNPETFIWACEVLCARSIDTERGKHIKCMRDRFKLHLEQPK